MAVLCLCCESGFELDRAHEILRNNIGLSSLQARPSSLALTTTALTTSGTPSFIQAQVTFTATVTSASGSIPDGETVTFLDDGVTFGTSATAAGIASLTTSALPTGSRSIKAVYSDLVVLG